MADLFSKQVGNYPNEEYAPVGERVVVLNHKQQPRFEITIDGSALRIRGIYGEFRKGRYFRESLVVTPEVSNSILVDLRPE